MYKSQDMMVSQTPWQSKRDKMVPCVTTIYSIPGVQSFVLLKIKNINMQLVIIAATTYMHC